LKVLSNQEELQLLLIVFFGFLISLLPKHLTWIGCVTSIFLVGNPHGALDAYLIWIRVGKNKALLAWNIFLYILAVAFSLTVWWLSPDVFWFLFIGASIYHFGISDEHPSIVRRIYQKPVSRILFSLCRGTLLVFSPAAFHPKIILSYLRLASSETFALGFVNIAPFAVVYSILLLLWVGLRESHRARLQVHRWFLIKNLFIIGFFVLLAAVAHPLTGFTLYFCCYHSWNHFCRVLNRERFEKKIKQKLIWATVFSLPIFPLTLWIKSLLESGELPEKAISSIFIVLAALTFPHLWTVRKMYSTWAPLV
jgi:Brp/Blh family beta-carotene 15,15'-monooxygenase